MFLSILHTVTINRCCCIPSRSVKPLVKEGLYFSRYREHREGITVDFESFKVSEFEVCSVREREKKRLSLQLLR